MKYKMPWMSTVFGEIFNCHCYDWPYFWPGWVGGNQDFTKVRGQPFKELNELRAATLLEF